MTHTERSPKTPRTDMGFVAALRVSLRSRGGGASSVPRLRCALLVSALALLTLVLAATPALARQARVFSGSFGAASSTVANPYPLGTESSPSATGIAVDTSSGSSARDVYVADPSNFRVEKFSPAGEFLLMFGKEVNKTKVEEAGSTEAEQNVCAAASGDQCQRGTPGSSPGAFQTGTHSSLKERELYLAVDSSSGLSAGDVYVADPGDDRVSKFDSSGSLVTSWATGGQLDGASVTSPPAPLPGPFGELTGVAVDVSGNLWVYGTAETCGEETPCVHLFSIGRMFEFKQDAAFVTDWNTEFLKFPISGKHAGIAVDSEDNLYVPTGFLAKYGPAGALIGLVYEEEDSTPSNTFATEGVAVDRSTDDLYIDAVKSGGGGDEIRRYDPHPSSCHPSRFGVELCDPAESFRSSRLSPRPGAIAVDSSSPTATLYVVEEGGQVLAFDRKTVPDAVTAKATNLTSTSATLNGTVNPDGQPLTECFFEWGESTEPYEHTASCVAPGAAEVGVGTSPVPVHAAISGLQSGKTYHFRLLAANANDVNGVTDEPSEGSDFSFGPPRLDSESASNVSATDATIEAQVNPQSVDTRVQIEYGTDTSYGQSTTEIDLGSSGTEQSVSQHLQGLAPHTVYHYRVLAHSALGVAEGEDKTFTTQTPGPFSLPDHRAYEIVSPPNKHGAALKSIEGGAAVHAAASGDAITYLASTPTETEPEGSGFGIQLLSSRGPDGWSSRDIQPPHQEATGTSITFGLEYPLFSRDLSRALLQPFGGFDPALSPAASEQTPYLRTDFAAASFCTSSCYEPLLSACPPAGEPCPSSIEEAADVFPSGTHFSTAGQCFGSQLICGPRFVGASPDLGHILLSSSVALTPKGGTLYEWSADRPPAERLQSVSVLPPSEGGAATSGGVGSTNEAYEGSRLVGVVSADGSRVFWSHFSSKFNGALYLRANATKEQSAISGGECTEPSKACTFRLDLVQPGASGAGAPAPHFQFASADGSRVLFTDSQALTAGSGAEGEGGSAKRDLYQCDIRENGAGQPQCELTDLTPLTAGEHADLQAAVIGASEDGSSVYFVADGAITGAEESANHETALSGQPNLYVHRDGATKLVAVLADDDYPDWAGNGSKQKNEEAIHGIVWMSARVSPDGRWLAFMSQRPLTGYDNRDAATGRPDEEVYLYNAAAEKLLCASCNPTGARSLGTPLSSAVGANEQGFLGTNDVWNDETSIAALLPGWTLPTYQSRYLSDSGRLYFESLDPLAPQDSNGTWDVYQYEPPQGGESPPSDTCTPASTTYSPASQGCIGLISSGASPQPTAFIDASESGDDVFFLSAAQLSSRDQDTSYDVYDAKVGGGEPEPVKPVECVGDACQRPAVPPNDPTPGSLTFHGAGNLHETPAKKKHPKKHRKHKHHKRASHNRGGRK